MARVALKNIQLDSVRSRSSRCRCSVKKLAELGGVTWFDALVCVTPRVRCVCICVWEGDGGRGGSGSSRERDRRRSLFFWVQPLAHSPHFFFFLSYPPPPHFPMCTHINTHSHNITHWYTNTPSVYSSRSLEIWVAMSRKASGAPQSRV